MNIVAAKDQENLVHNLLPKSLAAKTPAARAPKTPFKIPLNDENTFTRGGKSGLNPIGKGNENLFTAAKKDGKLDANAFVTPAGPRSRAPLGMKTTNAKAAAFKTPAPLSASAKTQKASPRLRRPKVKIHQPEAQTVEDDDVPEIEYMPPKEVPLPDDMDDYLPRDWKFPMFEGKNATKGIWETYHNPIEADGRTKLERQFEEGLERDKKQRDEEFDRMFAEQWEKDQAEVARHFGTEPSKETLSNSNLKSTKQAERRAAIPTVKARSAAVALARPTRPTVTVPVVASKSRLPSAVVSSKKTTVKPSTTRHAEAAAASKSTIGYAQGRATTSAATARKPISNVTKPAPFSTTSRLPLTSSNRQNRSFSTSSMASRSRSVLSRSSSTSTNATLVTPPLEPDQETYRTAEDLERDIERMLLEDEEGDDDAWIKNFESQLGDGGDPFDDDLDDFQLQLPAGL